MFFRFGIIESYRVSTRGVGATAFPRQLMLLNKMIVLECFAPETHAAHRPRSCQENYKKGRRGRRGDSIPETAYATKQDDCIGMLRPRNPCSPPTALLPGIL
ncbi:MAG: hypothetical protein F6J93_03355 [Oscillatoria sp. SIO1A7]|nr:hypothetical protein [Oscillatoria sp. SIO1A7]